MCPTPKSETFYGDKQLFQSGSVTCEPHRGAFCTTFSFCALCIHSISAGHHNGGIPEVCGYHVVQEMMVGGGMIAVKSIEMCRKFTHFENANSSFVILRSHLNAKLSVTSTGSWHVVCAIAGYSRHLLITSS